MRWLCTALCLQLVPVGAWGKGAWEQVLEEDGITVYARDNGTALPTFRGEGLIHANILQILAVFRDDARHEEWMASCKESTIIKRLSELEAYVYNRTAAPWPVSDRDVVIHAKLSYDLNKLEAWNRFRSVELPSHPEVEGVVRMPSLQGFYHLVVVNQDTTAMVYQVDSNPGGMLPEWLVRMATRKLPLTTIQNLRKQVAKTRNDYGEIIQGWVRKFNLPHSVPGGLAPVGAPEPSVTGP